MVASRLQNPDENLDVSDDGNISAIDALLVINRLSRSGSPNGIPVGPDDRGPFYYDVNGDQRITTIDAFRVINELSRRDAQGKSPHKAKPPRTSTSSASLPSLSLFTPIDVEPHSMISTIIEEGEQSVIPAEQMSAHADG